jgi:hypothetical protein
MTTMTLRFPDELTDHESVMEIAREVISTDAEILDRLATAPCCGREPAETA